MTNRHMLLLPAVALAFLAFSAAPALAETNYGVTGSFGSASSSPADPEPLSEPTGVAVSEVGASKGDVYVVDHGNKRVEYFSSTGGYLGQFNGSAAPGGAFSSPEGIAVDNDPSSPSAGDVYVTDTARNAKHNVIDKFSSTGAYEGQFTGSCENGEESPPSCPKSKFVAFGGLLRGVAVDAGGNLWVYGTNSEKEQVEGGTGIHSFQGLTVIYKFSDTGSFVKAFGGIFVSDELEKGVGEHEPRLGIAVDSNDELYVSGYKNSTFGFGPDTEKYNSSGVVLEDGTAGAALTIGPSTNNLFLDEGASVAEYGTLGFGEPPIAAFPSKGLAGSEGIAVSVTGTVYATQRGADNVDILTVGATPTAPVTEETKEITAVSATLHGELSGGETEYYFEYNDNGGCTRGGETSPVASTATGAKVSADVTGLDPSASYSVCLVSENPFGKTVGSAEPFTTAGVVPEIIAGSESASNVRRPVGLFTAMINPNNQETQYSVEYSTEGSTTGDTLEGEVQTAEGAPVPAEFGDESVSVEARLEERSATYYYRIVAKNATGEATPGKVQSYTKLPVVGGGSVSELTSTTATLEATLDTDFANTTYVWEYATEAALLGTPSATKVAGLQYVEGNTEPGPPQPLSEEITGLQPETVYYYRLVAANETTENVANLNGGKPVDGAVHSFRTLAKPAVTTGGAESVTRTTATLSGTVNPEGAETTYYFEYISEATFQAALAKGAANPYGPGYQEALEKGAASPYAEGETTTPISAGSGIVAAAVGPVLTSGLLPGETYQYALVAKNKIGVKVGPPKTLTTQSGTPPIVTTGAASAVSQNAASISGTVGTNSLQTSYGFEIATEPGNYGPATGLGSIGGAATEVVSLTLTELQPGTTYYYRVTATNADGSSQGAAATFTTPGFPTLLLALAPLPQLETPTIAFPTGSQENTGTGTPTKTLTDAQKLSKALKACRKKKSKAKRASCEKQARKKYSSAKKSKEKGK